MFKKVSKVKWNKQFEGLAYKPSRYVNYVKWNRVIQFDRETCRVRICNALWWKILLTLALPLLFIVSIFVLGVPEALRSLKVAIPKIWKDSKYMNWFIREEVANKYFIEG